MYWTLELASKLEDAPWPATKDELIDYATRSGVPLEVLENLQEIAHKLIIFISARSIEYKRYGNFAARFPYHFYSLYHQASCLL